MSNQKDNLLELVSEFRTCMLITTTDDLIAARPMSMAAYNEQDGSVTFATSLNTEKVDEIKAQPSVAVSFQSSSRYASLSGSAVISNDREHIHALYSSAWKVWFPEGPNQVDIRLIHFRPTIGEYWDMSGTKGIRFIWEAGKAMVLGESMGEEDVEQHAKTTL